MSQIIDGPGSQSSQANAFVEAALQSRLDDARALITTDRDLTKSSLSAAVVYGDSNAAERLLTADPGAADRPCGPRSARRPLHYATDTGFIRDPERRQEILDCIRLLLNHGADPNATYEEEPWMGFPLTPLYGAAGKYNDIEMAALIIDAGAKLDDNESLYHSLEHPDHRCTKLLLERGANPNSINVLAHQLDNDEIDGLRLLLDYGSDPNTRAPNGGNALHWAVMRRRSPECIQLLLSHGANPNVRMDDGMSAYRLAVRGGQEENATLLRTPEVESDVTAIDRLAGTAARGDRAAMDEIVKNDPSLAGALNDGDHVAVGLAAEDGDITRLTALLDAGFSPNGRSQHNATALHWAAWRANLPVAQLLIARGADMEATGATLGTTPLQWAIHGSANNQHAPQEGFLAVIELLITAGAKLDSEWIPMGSKEVQEALRPSE